MVMSSAFSALDRRQRAVLLAASMANALIFFDQTAVTTALPAIQRDLGMTSTEVQWVIGAYLLALAALMSASGRLADLYGRRLLFVSGAVIFGVGSIACVLAPADGQLIAARVIQGCGAALTMPLTIATVTSVLPDDRRGWAIGVLATGGTVFLGLGPFIGGFLLEVADWRWIFAVNIPVVIAIVVLMARWLPERRSPQPERLDWPGLTLLLVGLVALVTALLEFQDWGATDVRTLGLAGLTMVTITAFVVVEGRVASPLIHLRLLRLPAVAGSMAALTVIQFSVLAVTVYVLLYLQLVLGMSGLAAAFAFLPTVVATPIFSPLTGRLADAGHACPLVVGGLLVAVIALVWMALAAGSGDLALLLPAFLIFGLSRPLIITPASTRLVNAISAEERGFASGLVTEARQIGAVLGVAMAGAVVTAIELPQRAAALARIDPGLGTKGREALDGILAGNSAAGISGLSPADQLAAHDAATSAYAAGFSGAMLVAAGLAAITSVLAFRLLRRTGPV